VEELVGVVKKKCPARDALGDTHCCYEFAQRGCESCRYNWLPFIYLILNALEIKKVDIQDAEEVRRELRRSRDENAMLRDIIDRFSGGMRQVISAHEMASELRDTEDRDARKPCDNHANAEGEQSA